MKVLNLAILGQGRSGRDIHGSYLRTATDRFKIVAIADPIEGRRRRAAEEYGCEVFADYHDLMSRDDLDFVVNSTPSHLHVLVTRELLDAGFNVLCEKPLARCASEVDDLIAASKRAGKVLAIFQQSRFTPPFLKVQEVIASGVLGRIVQINMAWNGFGRRWDWQTLQKFNGGSLLNTGPHPVDQALQLFGDGMPEVFCRMDRATTYGDAEDNVKLILSGAGHPTIDVEISCCAPYPCHAYSIYGTCGGLRSAEKGLEWKYFKPDEAPAQHLIEEPICKPDGQPAYCTEKLNWYTETWEPGAATTEVPTNPTGHLYYTVYNTLTTGAPLEVTPEQVRRQIAVMEECRRQNPQIYGA
jgi:scyllo-inositol 2-dehydrogenase (NADP+)